MTDPHMVWSFPEGGVVPDLGVLLEARDMAALTEAAEPGHSLALAGVLAERDRAVEDARAVARDLKAKGITFDVDRLIGPTWWERMQDKWDDAWEWWHRRSAPDTAPPPDTAIFSVGLALAMTRPTGTIALDGGAIDAEVDRFVEAVSRQITVSRGRGPSTLHLPDAVLDDLAEQDEWSEADEILMSAGSLRAYWPPSDGPAIALFVEQQDGGLSIDVSLAGHGVLAHGRFLQILAQHGGGLS